MPKELKRNGDAVRLQGVWVVTVGEPGAKGYRWTFEGEKLFAGGNADTKGIEYGLALRMNGSGRMTVTGHVPTSLTLAAAIDSGMDQVAHLPIRGDLASDSGKAQIAYFKARGTVFDPTASWGEIGGHSTAEPLEHFQPGAPHMPSP